MTIGDNNHLLAELQLTLEEVDLQMEQVRRWAANQPGELTAYHVRDIHGGFLYAPLLSTKANLLVAITELRRGTKL